MNTHNFLITLFSDVWFIESYLGFHMYKVLSLKYFICIVTLPNTFELK